MLDLIMKKVLLDVLFGEFNFLRLLTKTENFFWCEFQVLLLRMLAIL